MTEQKQQANSGDHRDSRTLGYATATTTFKTMHSMHEQHEDMIKEVVEERHGLGAEALEEVPKALGRAALGVALVVELKPVVVAAWQGDSVKAEDELLKAVGSMGGMAIGMVAGGAAGTEIPFVGNVIGGVAGGVMGAELGEKLMENLTKKMHEEYGENNTIAMGMIRHAYAKLEPHIGEAYHAAQHGIDRLEHPVAQSLLEHTRETVHQAQVAHEVARHVDINLAAPVLNTMQTLGSAQTVVEAAHELHKLGPASDVTYGKAATDMAAVLTLGERMMPSTAADILDKASLGRVVPQYDIRSTAALTGGQLARQAESGNIGAQYALLSQFSLVFSPTNDAAASRLQSMVNSELRRDPAVDWKALDTSLQASNERLASRSAQVLAQADAPRLDRPLQYEAPHEALER